MRTLVIGNKNYSSWSLRAWLALRHLEVDFEERVVPLYVPDHRQVLGKLSPSGKVPLLIDGDIRVWESLAIGDYATEISDLPGWPEDPAGRALARSICAEMHAGFPDLRNALPMNCRAHGRSVPIEDGTRRDIERIQTIWQQCLAGSSGNGWLFGHFTIADAMFAPVVFRFDTYGIELDDVCKGYVEHVLADSILAEWIAAAEQETWVLDFAEFG